MKEHNLFIKYFLTVFIVLIISMEIQLKKDDLPIGSHVKFLTLQEGINILENNIAKLDIHDKNEGLTDGQKKQYSHSIMTLKQLKEEREKHGSHDFKLQDSKEFVDKLEAKIRLYSHPDDLPFVIQKIERAKIMLASTDIDLSLQQLDLPLIYVSGLFHLL